MKLSIPLLLSLALHALLVTGWLFDALPKAKNPEAIEIRITTQVREEPAEMPSPPPRRAQPEASASRMATPASNANQPAAPLGKTPASQAAPPPPSAEEWQLASTYKLKNSKRYRHNLGQLVRSMMGTAVEGPEQGVVRLRIEIAPDGTLANVTELWSTSETASKLALQAIRSLPPLPPTPTGQPLIFERTISFLPYETGWPPSYTLDCLPDPPAFKNPFAWDGKTPPTQQQAPKRIPAPADAAQEKCVNDSTAETIEQEETEMKRQMEVYRWGR
jgi:TonB family protein